LNDRLGIVHGVWLSPRHIAQIAGAGIVHNPISNLKLKSGVHATMQFRVSPSNCSSNSSGTVAAFGTEIAAPAAERLRIVQSRTDAP
jgi:hypothetical protein